MKSLIFGGMSAFVVAIAAASLAMPASARPGIENTAATAPATPTLLAQRVMLGESSMTFNFTAPFITSSGIRGGSHFIRLAVVGMSLKDLMISIPSQMEHYENLRVVDQNGQNIPAKISVSKKQAAIVFDQPVAQDTHLEILFTDVRMSGFGGDTLFYGITAEHTGVMGEIPIGTARIQIPNRS